jgi:predicted house-cleaning noncanonical NTP pyrophosphatase (MazG superfamily)
MFNSLKLGHKQQEVMKMKVEYNKLVRDKIPQIIKDSGRTCEYKVLGDSEIKDALKEKLIEKAQIFSNKPSEDELSDIYELLNAIVETYDYEPLHIDYLKLQNKENKGTYSNRVYLISVDDGQ